MYLWCYIFKTSPSLVGSLNLKARVYKKLGVTGEGRGTANAIHEKPA